jgi:drug/metabolite transporter (DMT)-like permease
MQGKTKAHIALAAATIFFGLNYSVSKSLMPVFITPLPLVLVRLLGSIGVILVVSVFIKAERIQKADYLRIALCGFTGVTINQLFFFEGLSRTTPVETAIIHTSSPALVVLFSMFLLNEKSGFLRYFGIVLGGLGALILVLNGKQVADGTSHLIGNVLIIVNITSYALYLVLAKPLLAKYAALTVMKWVFISGLVFTLPYAAVKGVNMSFSHYTTEAWAALLYVVFITTFLAFTLTVYSLKHLSPGIAGYYIYLQPLIASAIGLTVGQNPFTIEVGIASVFIFTGVYLVNRKPRQLKANA